ncbi:MAG: sigma-70 family RNA polymerase sigma factor [Kiritimatiellae bacterium]|nr:sigma-70 family RNA polymerase sigma factor [Kiritimatiellia bacterium]
MRQSDRDRLAHETDEQLLERAKRAPASEAGRLAFDLFVTRHRAFAVNLANSYLDDPDLARDFAQDGFVRLYGMLPRYEPKAAARGLLARIVRNACLTHRSRERRIVPLADISEAEARGAADSVAGDALSREEDAARLRAALGTLPERQQEALRLRYFQDMSYKEIAAALDITVNYAGVILHQALSALRDRLG